MLSFSLGEPNDLTDCTSALGVDAHESMCAY